MLNTNTYYTQIAGVKVQSTRRGRLSPQHATCNQSTNMRNIYQLNVPALPNTDVRLQDLQRQAKAAQTR